jgi:heme exporter protein C
MWWKITLFFWIAALSAVAIVTPVAGTFSDVAMMTQGNPDRTVPVRFHVSGVPAAVEGGFLLDGRDAADARAGVLLAQEPSRDELAAGFLADARYDATAHHIVAVRVRGAWPGFAFPFIPGLEERAKIIFFHVPMAWMAVIAFFVSMWFGIKYLRGKDLEDDLRSAVSAGLGLLFCILATTTGSLWAKFNWGSFWNWDPRESSIFVLLLVYGAYFALRSAIDIDEKRASLSAVYGIIATVTVPFFIFIMPRIMPGLHPGSAGDVNSGPVVSKGGMDASMRVILYGMLAGFIVLYAWMMSLNLRVHRLGGRQDAVAAE